ncbi:unnamed protein product [Schistosoma curassoni]|uniref:Uncharacterized protein n=1 Tax=Schistosoma curassoni TaxID=6186 RepID=A0A183KF82_9TREM|nr:unnamed protein product [Schistosoma curassoni]
MRFFLLGIISIEFNKLFKRILWLRLRAHITKKMRVSRRDVYISMKF